jgi:hypothetical protein
MTKIDRMTRLREQVRSTPRIAGEYLIEFAPVAKSVFGQDDLIRFLRVFAAPFGFSEPDVTDEEWKHGEVFREEAIVHLTEQLKGGSEIGHSRWDVEPPDALHIASTFASLINDDGRFFCNRRLHSGEAQVLGPYASAEFRNYIFDGGCVAIDAEIAAIFWIFDND